MDTAGDYKYPLPVVGGLKIEGKLYNYKQYEQLYNYQFLQPLFTKNKEFVFNCIQFYQLAKCIIVSDSQLLTSF